MTIYFIHDMDVPLLTDMKLIVMKVKLQISSTETKKAYNRTLALPKNITPVH